MASSATFSIRINSGSYASGAADADGGDVITCKLDSVTDIQPGRIAWDIFGTHGAAAPATTLGGTPIGETVSFTLPAGASQAYGIRCRTNGGAAATGRSADTYKSAVYVAHPNGKRPYFIGESFEGDSTYGIVPRLNDALAGDATGAWMVLRSTPLHVAGSSGQTAHEIRTDIGDVVFVRATAVARDVTNGDSAAYRAEAAFENTGGSLATLSATSGSYALFAAEEDASWSFYLDTDGADVIEVNYSGDATNDTQWRIVVEYLTL